MAETKPEAKAEPSEIGSVVRVKGILGPKMVVTEMRRGTLSSSPKEFRCMWFDKHDVLHREYFRADELEGVLDAR